MPYTPNHAMGRPLTAVTRRGKHLLLGFDGDPALTYVVHLMQGGRLKPDEKQSPKPRGGLARWLFADGRALLFLCRGTSVTLRLHDGSEVAVAVGIREAVRTELPVTGEVCSEPSAFVARGKRSFVNITPWPTNTSSSIVTPGAKTFWSRW